MIRYAVYADIDIAADIQYIRVHGSTIIWRSKVDWETKSGAAQAAPAAPSPMALNPLVMDRGTGNDAVPFQSPLFYHVPCNKNVFTSLAERTRDGRWYCCIASRNSSYTVRAQLLIEHLRYTTAITINPCNCD